MPKLRQLGKDLVAESGVVRGSVFGARYRDPQGVPCGGYGFVIAGGRRTERCFPYFADAMRALRDEINLIDLAAEAQR